MIFKDHLQNLPVYEAGKPIELVVREFGIDPKKVIKLASNENPLGTSKNAMRRIKSACAHLYPDDSFFELKDALAAKYGVKSENIIIGAGSDQIIEFIMHASGDGYRGILSAGVTFAMYGIYANQLGAKHFKTSSITHDLNELLSVYKAHQNEIAVIFLCVPNNPLGECNDAKDIYSFIEQISPNTLVAIDGAYMQFAAYKDQKKLIAPKELIKRENTIFLGTFSKAYGMGGMRVGYGIANEQIIQTLHKLRAPFNITTPSLAGAIEALKDDDFIDKTLKNNSEQMKRYEDFAKKYGIKYIDSYTNFITLFPQIDSTKICDNLLKKGIIIRNLKSYGLNAIRITIGTKAQNSALLRALKKELFSL